MFRLRDFQNQDSIFLGNNLKKKEDKQANSFYFHKPTFSLFFFFSNGFSSMASSSANRAVILREYAPTGLPEPGKHFTVDNVDEPGALGDGEVTVQLKYISVDPYLRGRMKDRESYFPAFEIGQPGANFAVFEVVASKSAAHPVGSTWAGTTPWVLRQ